MMKKLLIVLAGPLLFASASTLPAAPASETPPDLLPPVTIDAGNDLKRRVVPNAGIDEEGEPEVVIRKRGKNMVEEYRINGRLYKVKVTPAAGPAYYMVDSDGDGIMDQRYDQLGHAVSTPQWVLFSW